MAASALGNAAKDEASAALFGRDFAGGDLPGPTGMNFLPYMPNIKMHLHEMVTAIHEEPFGELKHIPQMPASAAEDPGVTGRAAIWAVIGERTNADALALSAQQAAAIARNSKVAAVRMLEAKKMLEQLIWKEAMMQKHLKDHKLPTKEDRIEWWEKLKDQRLMKPPEKLKPKIENPAMKGEFPYNMDDWNMKRQLDQAFDTCRTASVENALGARLAAQYSAIAANAAHAAAEAANLPGLQPMEWNAQVFKPPKRPRDLAPFWLDLPYAGSKGADPYSVSLNHPRRSSADLLRGTTRFNPFEGTVPFNERLAYKDFMAGKPLYPFQNGVGKYPMDLGVNIPDPNAAAMEREASKAKATM